MRKVGRLLALLLGLLVPWMSSAASAVDMTGRWRLDFPRFGAIHVVDLAQTGATVVGEDVPADGNLEYVGSSAPDSASGAFQLSGPPSCGPSQLVGTVAPDGQTLTGVQDAFLISPMPGEGCVDIQLDVTGVRIGQITPVCGNRVIEVPERCDDGNVTAGDGCGPDCRIEQITPVCGNGHIDAGEQCDDGNLAGRDGCSPACSVEACFACNGQPSICIPTPCGLCESSPRVGCRTAGSIGRVTLRLKNKTPDEGDRLTWKWPKGETALADFGDPLNLVDYALCVWDRSGPMPVPLVAARVHAAVTCGDTPCWKATGTGFSYKDRAASNDGVQSIRLKAGAAGRAAMQVKARGPNLLVPALPLAEPVALTVQLQAAGAACWQADYGAAGVVANDGSQLRARPE
jgi:cysteine-rich repeat protein